MPQPACGSCGSTVAVHAYRLVLAGQPRAAYWRCRRCAQVDQEYVDLRPMPAWQERVVAGDTSGARVSGGHAR